MHRSLVVSLAVVTSSSCIAPRATGGRDSDASTAMLRAEVEQVRAALADAHSDIRAGRDADASISGLRAQVESMQTGLVAVQHELHAGRDVNTNDAWTLRLLGFGVLLLGLSYPVGKLVWLALATIRRKTGSPDTVPNPTDVRDYLMMKERNAEMVTLPGDARHGTVSPSRDRQDLKSTLASSG